MWGILKKFQVDIQQAEMEAEVETSIHHQTAFHRWKHEKKTSELHYMFPINETSIFDYNRKTSLSIIPESGVHVNPKIYTQLHERRSTDRGTGTIIRAFENYIYPFNCVVINKCFKKMVDRYLHLTI